MWEAIRSNRRRSKVLITLMGIILVLLGFGIGGSVDPQMGGAFGALVALGIWFFMCLFAMFGGDSMLLMSANAHKIEKKDAPQLWNVVEEMTIASGLGKMPDVYIIDESAPNAFAVGRNPQKAAVAITAGLMKRLNRDELQGVIAHEIGHIKNLDIRFMTQASVMLGSIVLISDLFLRSLWFGGGRRSSRNDSNGQAQAIMLLLALLLAILAPILAQMLYFACSRQREYLADASAARFTRYPEGLASALEKISGRIAGKENKTSRVLAPMYIINPLQSRSAVGLLSTHPPTERRIQILRSMAKSAGFLAYENAYRSVCGQNETCIGKRSLAEDEDVPVREAAPEPVQKKDAMQHAREVSDLLDGLANFLVIPCLCGVRIKVPSTFKKRYIQCPRCGTKHERSSAKPLSKSDAA